MSDEGLKRRNTAHADDEKSLIADDDAISDLPYKGKVFLARRKKPDSWKMIAFQVR